MEVTKTAQQFLALTALITWKKKTVDISLKLILDQVVQSNIFCHDPTLDKIPYHFE
ncbi:hypothetical protein BBKW_1604 [Bifidobacterium catenulatum subsp. kashiwanohense JCM 15439 = DSM 21854]|nr:hypothetical protein BBKW_1604 [Bifidobacterium catenulatum subsp. kashiwanohense JCM 15439 = DSM 21854]